MKKNQLVYIVAAGTGGHIYPGISYARHLENQGYKTCFIGSKERMEARIIPELGFSFETIRSAAWKGRSLWTRLKTLFVMFLGFLQSWKLLGKTSQINHIISFGGYISVPFLLAAKCRGIPFFIVEPNVKAGAASILLSRMAQAAFSYRPSDSFEKFHCLVEDTGIPLRSDLSKKDIKSNVGSILVVGGSLGAKFLLDCSFCLLKNNAQLKKLRWVIQTGEKLFEEYEEKFKQLSLSNVELKKYIHDIPKAFEEVDICLSRAGAMSTLELGSVGMPTVFVPYPYAADDHQNQNADYYVENKAAFKVKENLDRPELSFIEVEQALEQLLEHPKRLEFSKNIQSLVSLGAAQKIDQHIKELLCK